jgi:hypothetical protein
MSRERDLYERVEAALAEGAAWRAKEILQGNIATRGYDTRLFARYGQLLLQMGDLVEAGKYLFLSGERQPHYEEAIALYLTRYTRKDPQNLVGTFPQAARLPSLDAYPEPVRQTLDELGIRARMQVASVPQPSRPPTRAARVALALGCALTLLVLVFLLVCTGVGACAVWDWLLGS